VLVGLYGYNPYETIREWGGEGEEESRESREG